MLFADAVTDPIFRLWYVDIVVAQLKLASDMLIGQCVVNVFAEAFSTVCWCRSKIAGIPTSLLLL